MQGVLAIIDDSIRNLPTVPEAPQRVIAKIHDPLATVGDLAELINGDPVFSMRVLHVANSVAFAGIQPITDLRRACARLGAKNIANIAYVVAQGHLYRSVNRLNADLMEQLWRHAVASARLAESFAKSVPGLPKSSVFLTALVHDIGKTVLLDAITNRYKGRAGRLKDSPEILVQTLNDFAPYAGLRVVQHWKLPPEIRFATFYAVQPAAAPDEFRPCASLVALASAIADTCGYGTCGEATRDAESVAADLAEHLGITNLGAILATADEDIAAFLDLAQA